jgi:hypothetical protein
MLEGGGTVAWATVLEAREKWQSETSGFSGVKITSHMHVKLRVEPDGEPPFEASFGQAIADTVPFTGGICKVVYDPDDHSKIQVLDGTAAPPGFSREKAERAHANRTEMMDALNSGHIAEYIQQRQAEAMNAFGGAQFAAGQIISGAAESSAAPHQSVADQLTKLADLKDRGALTEAEFETEKAKLLGGELSG